MIAFGLVLLEAAAVLLIGRGIDRRQQVSAERLLVALETFRPSEIAGRAGPVPAADLAPERSVRTEPAECAALSLLSTGEAIDGATWSGVGGQPAQPVTTLTVRYPGPDRARAALTDKQLALWRCRTVRLTFPPFDEPAQDFRVSAGLLAVLPPDQVSYVLESGADRYEFYVRRWGNTVTWTYDKDRVRARVGRGVVEDLVRRLESLARE